MIGRSAVIARFPGGSQMPPQEAIVAPGASYAVARNPIARDHGGHGNPAMEMPALWKPPARFPQRLGNLAHDARFPHSHSRSVFVSQEEDEEDDVRHASRTTARQTATA